MMDKIIIKNAYSNNLQNLSLEIPRNKFIVITGPSGSGKSSLAFDTIYKEGQRRFLESLSSFGRSYLQSLEKPKVDSIEGLSPAIAIDQKSTNANPRSTVGTITDIYTYLRLLFVQIATPHSPDSGLEITPQDKSKILKDILKLKTGSKLVFLAPILQNKKGEHRDILTRYESLGFTKIRVNGKIQYIDEPLKVDIKKFNNIDLVVDRIVLKKESKDRIEKSLNSCLSISKGSLILLVGNEEKFFSQNYYCPKSKKSYPALDESLFSFNSPRGYCPECKGLGRDRVINEQSLTFDSENSLFDGPLKEFFSKEVVLEKYVKKFFKDNKVKPTSPLKDYKKTFLKSLIHGNKDFNGLLSFFENYISFKHNNVVDNNLSHLITYENCSSCDGKKLNNYALAATVNNYSISDLCDMEISDFHVEILKIQKAYKKNIVAQKLLKEIVERTKFLLNIGLNYLTLNRSAATLSGGEFQRIRLSTQLGSFLSGVVYILDEPSIGLHQRDNDRLLNSLKGLKDLNNTVIVVEHDEETMKKADHIIDIGPESGLLGGKIVFQGTLSAIKKAPESITGKYLSHKLKIEIPKKRRKPQNFIELKGAKQNNLSGADVLFPLEVFTCITGVSGSGKSTLIHEILVPALKHKIFRRYPRRKNFTSIKNTNLLDDIIRIDQSPIGRTPKSIPLTYCGIFTHIRNIFANTNQAKIQGLDAGFFSFNVKRGQCDECEGNGSIKFEMPFLSNVYNPCPKCKGKRYSEEVLAITYRGFNIDDILNMSVREGLEFFKNHKKIHYTLQTLSSVGLDYLKLGQPSPTLSGGEAQRIKLSRELSKIKKGKCLYILDEPTTGLHFNDIRLLLDSLQKMVDHGHSVIVVEHNLDVIKTADYLIDLGPEGGRNGGEIVGVGSPEILSKNKNSLTAKYLKTLLK